MHFLAVQSHFLCGLNIAENNCGVWSHDQREKSSSATLNNHLASAAFALILAGGICCKEVEGSCSWLLDVDDAPMPKNGWFDRAFSAILCFFVSECSNNALHPALEYSKYLNGPPGLIPFFF